MKNTSYIQVGLLAVVVALSLLRTREGFEEATPLKCPGGGLPVGEGNCFDKREPGVEPQCPQNYTYQGEEKLCTRMYSDGSEDSGIPRSCSGNKFLDPVTKKCFPIVPAECPVTSDLYSVFEARRGPGDPFPSLCVPKSRTTYPGKLPADGRLTPSNISLICNTGDKVLFDPKKTNTPNPFVCLSMSPPPATTTTTTTTPPPATTTTTTTTPPPPPATSTSSDVQPRDTRSTTNAVVSSNESTIKEVIDSLKPFRPPTAPASDLEKERKEITDIAKRNLYFIQIALFLVLLAMLSYFMFSLDTANLLAFGLLCVGIAMGFFLRR
jgi:hypothetical protein